MIGEDTLLTRDKSDKFADEPPSSETAEELLRDVRLSLLARNALYFALFGLSTNKSLSRSELELLLSKSDFLAALDLASC